MITRQSGNGGLPHWGASDTYTLDGVNLLTCTASAPVALSPSCAHPVAGTDAYTTEIEGDQRVAFVPDSAYGHWRVWHGDGTVANYAPGIITGHGPLDWRLSTITDANGNTVTYDWATGATSIPQLVDIRYSDIVIQFATQARPDPVQSTDGEVLRTQTTRLSAIEETAAGSAIR